MSRPRVAARSMRRSLVVCLLAVCLLGGSLSAVTAAQTTPTPTPAPTDVYLGAEEIAALAAAFADQPLTGGQVAPRLSRFVSPEVFIFLQLDNPDPAQATAIRYAGVGVKGVFCAETQPDRSFTHFHRYDAPDYASGHGGDPGAFGYWLSWVAVDHFEARDGRAIAPGIDYEFSPTPPPSCGSAIPEPAFTPDGAHDLTAAEVQQLMGLFNDGYLTGGQAQPRAGRWVNDDVFLFLQGEAAPADATTIRYIGIGVKGVFCEDGRSSADFTHYHRVHAAAYREGHAGEPGEDEGYWLLWVAAQTFEAQDGRQVTPGVDRDFSPTPPPVCGDGAAATPAAHSIHRVAVQATEWSFDPAALTAPANDTVAIAVTNTGSQLHTLTIPGLGVDTGPLQPGQTFEVRFTAPAEAASFDIICTFPDHIEAGMTGRLDVH